MGHTIQLDNGSFAVNPKGVTPIEDRPNVNIGDHDAAMSGEILRCLVGSDVHGTALEGADRDELGVYIEPPEYVIGMTRWDYSKNRAIVAFEGDPGMPHHTWRTVPMGVRSGAEDTDLSMYSLRKFTSLAIKGNPSILLPLFAPAENVIVCTELGHELREMRSEFLSQKAVYRFLGYMESQRERMMGGGKRNRVPYRPELEAKHGYDTKFAAHAYRLASQGYEVATTGHLQLPMPVDARDFTLSIRHGEVPQDVVNERVLDLAARTRDLLERGETVLPYEPDYTAIQSWVMNAQLSTWGVSWL